MDKKWEEMTPEEKREVRFKRWLDAESVQFVSPEAKKKYQERVTRIIKAIKMEEPDSTPEPAEVETPAAEKVEETVSPTEPVEAETPAAEKVEEDISPAPAAASSEMESIRIRWKEVVAAAKGMGSRGNLDALLRSACEPIEVKDDTIVSSVNGVLNYSTIDEYFHRI